MQIWLLGYGSLLLHRQFCVDVARLEMTIDGRPLGRNLYDAARALYECCGRQYYVYSKYLNQTLGNAAVERLMRLTDDHIVAERYTVAADTASGEICGRLWVRLLCPTSLATRRYAYVESVYRIERGEIGVMVEISLE